MYLYHANSQPTVYIPDCWQMTNKGVGTWVGKVKKQVITTTQPQPQTIGEMRPVWQQKETLISFPWQPKLNPRVWLPKEAVEIMF